MKDYRRDNKNAKYGKYNKGVDIENMLDTKPSTLAKPERENKPYSKPNYDRGNGTGYSKPNNGYRKPAYGAHANGPQKPRVMEPEFFIATLEEFSKAIKYRLKSGELVLQNQEEYTKDDATLDAAIAKWHSAITVPCRATIGSMGYDIKTPVPVKVVPGKPSRIPTGLRCKMPFKLGLVLSSRSSVFGDADKMVIIDGKVDSDYFFAKKTAGIICIQAITLSPVEVKFNEGEAMANGIFIEYKRAAHEKTNPVTTKRDGGFGHTNNNNTKEVK